MTGARNMREGGTRPPGQQRERLRLEAGDITSTWSPSPAA